MEEAKNVKKQLDEKHGKQKFYNLSEEEEAGMQSLIGRRENSELVYFETDKSGKMSADTVENFCGKMLPHVDGNEVVDFDVVDRIDNENNSKAKCWMRILTAGSMWGHEDRIKQSVSTASGIPPVLYGLPKDHKNVNEGEPPMRPVFAANSGPASRLANLLAMLIIPCNEEVSAG